MFCGVLIRLWFLFFCDVCKKVLWGWLIGLYSNVLYVCSFFSYFFQFLVGGLQDVLQQTSKQNTGNPHPPVAKNLV